MQCKDMFFAFRRASLLFLLLAMVATAPQGWSQTRKPGGGAKDIEPPRFTLAATTLGDIEVPPLFYLEKKVDEAGEVTEEYRELPVEEGNMRGRQSLQLHRPTSLYIEKPGAKPGSRTFEPYMEIPAKSASDQLLLLFYHDDAGKPLHKIIDISPLAHPPGTVRMINLTRTRAALTAGGNPVPVPPGMEARTTPVPQEDGRFPLVVSQEISGGGVYQSPMRLLQFRRPGNRLLVVFSAMPVDEDTGEFAKDGSPVQRRVFRPDAVRFPDTVPGVEGSDPVASATPQLPIPEAASAVSPAPARECAVGVVAFGEKWAGGELELGIAGRSGVVRAALQPDTIVPVKLPVAGETLVALRSGGVPLGEVTVGGSMTNALLALAPPAHMEDPATFGLFETSAQSHPAGRVRVFNLTPYEMAFTTDKTPTYVNPRASALVPAAAAEDGKLPLKLALKVDGAWKLVDQTPRQAPGNDQRPGLFVFPSGSGAEAGGFSIVEKNL
jgi:hypothetical protein